MKYSTSSIVLLVVSFALLGCSSATVRSKKPFGVSAEPIFLSYVNNSNYSYEYREKQMSGFWVFSDLGPVTCAGGDSTQRQKNGQSVFGTDLYSEIRIWKVEDRYLVFNNKYKNIVKIIDDKATILEGNQTWKKCKEDLEIDFNLYSVAAKRPIPTDIVSYYMEFPPIKSDLKAIKRVAWMEDVNTNGYVRCRSAFENFKNRVSRIASYCMNPNTGSVMAYNDIDGSWRACKKSDRSCSF